VSSNKTRVEDVCSPFVEKGHFHSNLKMNKFENRGTKIGKVGAAPLGVQKVNKE